MLSCHNFGRTQNRESLIREENEVYVVIDLAHISVRNPAEVLRHDIGETMSRYISITDEVEAFLNKECPKDEDGKREETFNSQIKRLLKIGGK